MLDEVLKPIHQQFAERVISNSNAENTLLSDISPAHFHSILVGSANIFFALSFQNKRQFGVDSFDQAEIDKYVDFVNDTIFARFES